MKTITLAAFNPIVLDVEYHRNGVTGAGFWLAKIGADPKAGYPNLIAIKFDADNHIAVLDPQSLAEGKLDSKWRGDDYEEAVNRAIKARQGGVDHLPKE